MATSVCKWAVFAARSAGETYAVGFEPLHQCHLFRLPHVRRAGGLLEEIHPRSAHARGSRHQTSWRKSNANYPLLHQDFKRNCAVEAVQGFPGKMKAYHSTLPGDF